MSQLQHSLVNTVPHNTMVMEYWHIYLHKGKTFRIWHNLLDNWRHIIDVWHVLIVYVFCKGLSDLGDGSNLHYKGERISHYLSKNHDGSWGGVNISVHLNQIYWELFFMLICVNVKYILYIRTVSHLYCSYAPHLTVAQNPHFFWPYCQCLTQRALDYTCLLFCLV